MAAAAAGGKKRVVVIGGGVAGSFAAKSLQHHADVVLVDAKEYFEISWASLRTMVEPKFAHRTVVNHRDYFTNGRIVVSTATSVTRNAVTTAEGDSIGFDYLVIATGHTESVPRTKGERLNYYQDEFQKIHRANSVLIVGGGPSGVELAAEIAVDFPHKKVTLVHRGKRLLEFIGQKASKKAFDWLISHNVEVILGQSVNLNSTRDGIYKTSSGETVAADCHFVCVGKPTGSSWLRDTFLDRSLDDRGRLMVDEHLRVRGHDNIFAIGDITDIPELKQGYLAKAHALVTVRNIKLSISGKESKLGTYKPAADMAIVSLGRKEGVAQFPFMTIIGCFPGRIKSKDLFVGKTRKDLGLKSSA